MSHVPLCLWLSGRVCVRCGNPANKRGTAARVQRPGPLHCMLRLEGQPTQPPSQSQCDRCSVLFAGRAGLWCATPANWEDTWIRVSDCGVGSVEIFPNAMCLQSSRNTGRRLSAANSSTARCKLHNSTTALKLQTFNKTPHKLLWACTGRRTGWS